jgi:hypothetical protein
MDFSSFAVTGSHKGNRARPAAWSPHADFARSMAGGECQKSPGDATSGSGRYIWRKCCPDSQTQVRRSMALEINTPVTIPGPISRSAITRNRFFTR